eukprot:TRINITY_DN12386_c0_g1_i21.p1 TRINITY_DN12386_c0_g1~~TRINITY_DN12386_c0_g1_i21.p1  ORF type:complete len:210 (-),score=33.90 TRINITY_DN12386_c0_g1_i21:527-1063(-)
MNHLKAWCQKNSFYHLLTYADDTAIGYFQRQGKQLSSYLSLLLSFDGIIFLLGFSMEIKMDRKEWDIGFLKYYDSATLMHAPVDLDLGTLFCCSFCSSLSPSLILSLVDLGTFFLYYTSSSLPLFLPLYFSFPIFDSPSIYVFRTCSPQVPILRDDFFISVPYSHDPLPGTRECSFFF